MLPHIVEFGVIEDAGLPVVALEQSILTLDIIPGCGALCVSIVSVAALLASSAKVSASTTLRKLVSEV